MRSVATWQDRSADTTQFPSLGNRWVTAADSSAEAHHPNVRLDGRAREVQTPTVRRKYCRADEAGWLLINLTSCSCRRVDEHDACARRRDQTAAVREPPRPTPGTDSVPRFCSDV